MRETWEERIERKYGHVLEAALHGMFYGSVAVAGILLWVIVFVNW